MARKPTSKELELREACEEDLETFIKVVAPYRLLGHLHKELIGWWTRSDAHSHQLTLLPRDHAKSAMVAFRVAWEITRNPTTRVLYISSTANLAEKQLGAIKAIITSPNYSLLWPEMVNADEGKRAKWTNSEIAIDHPKRKEEGIRDPTVFTGGLTTSLTGLHCDIAVLDDVVVQENAYTNEGREKVKTQYSLLASIEGADAKEWTVGTRYHPKDLYHELLEMKQEVFDVDGNVVDEVEVYEVFERKVENRGDGTGEFLWPRQQRSDGKWFGFDAPILSRKKAQYLDKTQFYAQYYNDPNVYEDSDITANKFQYYDKSVLSVNSGRWFIGGRPLNVYASIDLAFSIKLRSDYTAIVVVGVDPESNIYVLDIDRFKTEKMSECYTRIRDLHVKWNFRKLRAEMVVAQAAVIREIRDMYIKPAGLALSIEEYYPTRHMGTKEERVRAILQPRYDNLAMWHYRGGNCQILEEEILQRHPAHDDLKDALASCVEIATPPSNKFMRTERKSNVVYHSRFGGISA